MSLQISTMKVKVRCCKSCQRKAKKILEQADGVQAICLDTNEGLLTFTGDVDPFLLMEMVEKGVRKRVELWSFHRYPVHGRTEDSNGGKDGRHDATKEAALHRKIDRTKAARQRDDGERARHAYPAPTGLQWPEPGGCHPMAGPCQHHGDPGQPPFWSLHKLPHPEGYRLPPQFPPPYCWYYPMLSPPMQPPPPNYYYHEAQQPKQ